MAYIMVHNACNFFLNIFRKEREMERERREVREKKQM